MKKYKKSRRLLHSFICLASGVLGLTVLLSSCVSIPNDDKNEDNSGDDIITTPPNEDNNENDGNEDNNDSNDGNTSEPSTKPETKPPVDNNIPNEPTTPDNKPTIPPNSNLITNDSISLKDNGRLLPSQYLLNINDHYDLKVDETKIIKNFDATNIVDTKYTISSLDDWTGVLSIKMGYKNKIDNKLYEFNFDFNNLGKLEDQNFSLSFNVNNKSLLNAKEIFDKSISNNDEADLFFKYLKEREVNLIFKNNENSLPINYLDFSGGLTIDGFKNSWYSSNNDIELIIKFKLLKVNAYQKSNDIDNLIIKKINYPVSAIGSIRKPAKIICSSALDYLLEKVIVNSEYKENKFASYYYYDIVYKQSQQTQLQLSNDRWLENITYNIEGYNKQYRPVMSNINNPKIDEEGNLTIQIQMELSDERIFSKNYKNLKIKSFLKLNENLFHYNGSKENKFNLYCGANEQDTILNNIKIKDNFQKIKNKININNHLINLNEFFDEKDYAKIKNCIKLYFGVNELLKDTHFDYLTSSDDKISIKSYYIDFNESIIQYDKTTQCFQIKCRLTIECEGLENNLLTSDYMIVNITKINASLE